MKNAECRLVYDLRPLPVAPWNGFDKGWLLADCRVEAAELIRVVRL